MDAVIIDENIVLDAALIVNGRHGDPFGAQSLAQGFSLGARLQRKSNMPKRPRQEAVQLIRFLVFPQELDAVIGDMEPSGTCERTSGFGQRPFDARRPSGAATEEKPFNACSSSFVHRHNAQAEHGSPDEVFAKCFSNDS